MAADDLKTEYHLTPTGWVKGTKRYFGIIDGDDVKRPDNAVETWQEHIYQRSMWSDESVTFGMLWHDESIPESDREAIRAKFKRSTSN